MKVKLLRLILSVILMAALGAGSAFAQKPVKVTGHVTDSQGVPVVGAFVLIKGTSDGVSTNEQGAFSISTKEGDILVVTFLGFDSQEISVTPGRKDFDVALKESSEFLQETVVIGYGTQRKGDVTSAVASVKSKDFLAGNISDASDMVRGKVAGLNITKGSGNPLASSTIRLRGITSMQADLTPLILVDGIEGDMGTVSPENIASIDVLKDASAAAIYGTRGANGVILITTKAGQINETLKTTYSSYGSISTWYKTADFMGPDEVRSGLTAFQPGDWDTDWLSAVTQIGWTQNHSLSLEGGTKSMAYFASVSYRGEEGVMLNTDNSELKMQADVTQYLLKDIVKLNLNIVKGLNKHGDVNSSYAYRQACIHNPTSPLYVVDADGNQDKSLGYSEEFSRFQYYNPLDILNEQIGDTQYEWTKMTGNITIEPIKGWKTNLMLTTDRTNSMSEEYYTSRYYSLAPSIGSADEIKGSASKSQYNSKSDWLEATTSYEFYRNKHHFSAMAGYSYNYSMYQGFSAGNSNFPTESYLYNNLNEGTFLRDDDHIASMSSYKNDNKLIGFFGRISYGYDDRYNVLVSFRHEGSSKLGANHKWGNFPSASAGWNINKEEFMRDVRWIDNLKLRFGFGVTGIIPSVSYASLYMYDYDSSYGNYLNSNGQWVAGLTVQQNANPDLKWETTTEYNLGIDYSFFGGRLGGSIDAYTKTTNDLLYYYTVPVPPNLYSTTLANVGVIKNHGIEVAINAIPVQTSDFTWNTGVTASHNVSKLVSLSNDLYETQSYINAGGVGDPISTSTHRIEVGNSFGNYWMLKSVGVTAKGKWVIENPKAVTQTGDTWYDADGNVVSKYMEYSTSLNSDDYRQYMGSGIPKVYLNWNNSFSYKGFDLSILLSSQLGFQIFNSQRAFYQNNSIAYNRLKSAADKLPVVDLATGQPTGETASLSTSQAQCVVSAYLERGDYLKVDNVTLGYTFNLQGKFKEYVKDIRLYGSGDNLICLTKYSGLDPELSNSDPFSSGLDERDKYPTIRSFTLGIKVTF
jgi:TonB-linked SusC/RagA family outer membrane protein